MKKLKKYEITLSPLIFYVDAYDEEDAESKFLDEELPFTFTNDYVEIDDVKLSGIDVLSEKEQKVLNKRLREIEIEHRFKMGLHRISGGFARAEFDFVEDDKIYIVLTDGVQSDCQNTTNVTHCSLWRNDLAWTN